MNFKESKKCLTSASFETTAIGCIDMKKVKPWLMYIPMYSTTASTVTPHSPLNVHAIEEEYICMALIISAENFGNVFTPNLFIDFLPEKRIYFKLAVFKPRFLFFGWIRDDNEAKLYFIAPKNKYLTFELQKVLTLVVSWYNT
jgi:hypothetical protein